MKIIQTASNLIDALTLLNFHTCKQCVCKYILIKHVFAYVTSQSVMSTLHITCIQ